MGFTAVILGLAIIVVGIVFIITILSNFEDFQEGGVMCAFFPQLCINTEDTQRNKDEVEKQQKEADARLPSTVGKTVCDLSVFVEADIIEKDFTIKIFMEENNPANYQWHCQFPNQWGFLNNWQVGNPLAYFLESEFVKTEIVLISMEDRSKRYDANHEDYDVMQRDTRLVETSGIVPTPLRFDQTFYIDDVVHGDYVLEIYQGRQINDLPVGEPILDKVCKVGTNC